MRDMVGPGCTLLATLKADAYGFGLLPPAQAVLSAGCDGVAVADLDRAVRLREAGLSGPVLLFARQPPGRRRDRCHGAVRARRHRVRHHDRDALAAHSSGPLQVAVKVDVGQDRLGPQSSMAPTWCAPC
ncbi:alanine racemase [Streptomyces peucetius]|uniref:Alanine racemase n=1 Tax=Streptomyces peucetius TaxID=1950 RepID=A0ABY6II86_STRPE|nr:alanine racemase [Streptomyces peucetius]UYQ66725.1 alanine racemase [Streptomyces peucetius]